MGFIENIANSIIDWAFPFLTGTFLPWLWDHRLWIAALIPLAVVISIAKWIRGG